MNRSIDVAKQVIQTEIDGLSYMAKRLSSEFEVAINEIKNSKDDKYYDEKGKGFSKTFFFKIPLTYKRISSKFTKKRWHPVLKRYRAHLGTDFAAPRGRKIYAAGDGRVEFKGRRGGYGNTIIINHQNGYKTLYAHQNGFRKGLKRGARVKKGQHIGYVGSTGRSQAPHLHYEVRYNGQQVNPINFYYGDLSPEEFQQMLQMASQEGQSLD